MKKSITLLALAVLVLSAVTGQHKLKKEEYDKYALPGNNYGLGFTVPPIVFPPNLTPRDPVAVDADLALEVLDGVVVSNPHCQNSFTAKYTIRVSSQPGNSSISVGILVKNSYLPEGENNPVRKIVTIPATADHVDAEVSFTMNYPALLIGQVGKSAKRHYFPFLYSIATNTYGGFVNSSLPTVFIIHDTNPTNNENQRSFFTPDPPSCVKNDHGTN